MARGALIVIEGCDRSGKTSQCNKLGKRCKFCHRFIRIPVILKFLILLLLFLSVSALQKQNIDAKYMNFPDRTTAIGQIIHQYLVSKVSWLSCLEYM